MSNFIFIIYFFWNKELLHLLMFDWDTSEEVKIFNIGYVSMTCLISINPAIGIFYYRRIINVYYDDKKKRKYSKKAFLLSMILYVFLVWYYKMFFLSKKILRIVGIKNINART